MRPFARPRPSRSPAPAPAEQPVEVAVGRAGRPAAPQPSRSRQLPSRSAAAAGAAPMRRRSRSSSLEARPALSPAAVRLSDSLPTLRKAAAPRAANGKSRAVVQLGAYSSRDRVAAAWSKVAGKYGSLQALHAGDGALRRRPGHRLSPVGQGLRQQPAKRQPVRLAEARRRATASSAPCRATRRSSSLRANL